MLRGSRRPEGQALKTSRDRSGNLQGGPEEDAVEREVIPVAADAHATPADAELGVEATLEHFRAERHQLSSRRSLPVSVRWINRAVTATQTGAGFQAVSILARCRSCSSQVLRFEFGTGRRSR